jgi:hypothetical protein
MRPKDEQYRCICTVPVPKITNKIKNLKMTARTGNPDLKKSICEKCHQMPNMYGPCSSLREVML